LAFEYPGYGVSKGETSTKAINSAASTVFDYLVNDLRWPAEQVVLCGRSLGTGPAIKLASENEVGGLVLISAFTSIKDVARNLGSRLLSFFVGPYWQNIDTIKNVKCPILFMHGKKDRLVSPRHSKILFQNCEQAENRNDIRIIDGVGHNNINNLLIVLLLRNFLYKSVYATRSSRLSICVEIVNTSVRRKVSLENSDPQATAVCGT